MRPTALIQVLGAVAYGEWKAYEGALARAGTAATDAERRTWERTAAEERRHYDGFVGRLEALGADPERAMRPYRRALDRYHGTQTSDPVEEAVWSFLGEGIADDLLVWLRRVADAETAAFVDTVLADEEGHEARAAGELRTLLRADPAARLRAAGAVARMLRRMAFSGQAGAAPLTAFLRCGRPHELLAAITGGYARRVRVVL